MKLLVIGQNSEPLRSLLERASYALEDVTYLPLFTVKPPKVSMVLIREQRPRIIKALAKYKKHTILGIGGDVLKAVLDSGGQSSVTDYRGRGLTFEGTRRKVFMTYDPLSILKNPENGVLILEDLRRLTWKKESWPTNRFPTGKVLGLDTEYTEHDVLDVSLSGTTVARCVSPTDKGSLRRVFAIPKIVGHSIGGDVTSLIKLGCKRNDWAQGLNLHDSFITSRMADENRGRGNYNVESMLLSKHNIESWKHKTEAYHLYDPLQWPEDLRRERCNLDAWGGLHVYQDWEKEAKGPVQLQTQFALTLERMKLAGAYVDIPAFDAWTKTVAAQHKHELDILTKIAMKRGMREFSPTKPNDIRELFFKRLKLPVDDYTKTGLPAVTKGFLSRYKDTIPEVASVLQFRKTDKLFTTYVQGIRKKVVTSDLGSYIPVRVGAMGTRTGRRASDKPNMQNWTKSARAMIFSRWNKGLILDNDFSKLEIMLLAYESEDWELFDYFDKEANGYIAIGTKLFGKTVEADTPEYRQVKAVVLGVNYNLQTYGLARQLWDLHGIRLSKDYEIHEEKVGEIRQRYLRMFPRVVAYQKERVRELHKYGSCLGWFGHLRRLPIPEQPPRSEGKIAFKQWRRHVAHLENEAINFKIQNAASYVTGTAMLDTERLLLSEYKFSYTDYHRALAEGRSRELNMPLLIGEVHDDLVYDTPGKDKKKAQAIIHEGMTGLVTLKKMKPEFDIQLKVDQKSSLHWGSKDGS